MKKDKRFQVSRRAIFEAAIQMFITDPSAGMSDVAAAAGVGRATLYRHFETKDDLIRFLVLECMKQTEEALEGVEKLEPKAAIEMIFSSLMPLADKYQFLTRIWGFMENDPELAQIEEGWNNDLVLLMKTARQDGVVSQSLPISWLAAFFDATFEAAFTLVSKEELSPEDAAKYAVQSFFGGCS